MVRAQPASATPTTSATAAAQKPRRIAAIPICRQNSAYPGTRGNGMTSRMFFIPVMYMSIRSARSPNPATSPR